MTPKKKLLDEFAKIQGAVHLDGLTITSEVIDRRRAELYRDAMMENQRNVKRAKVSQFTESLAKKWHFGIGAILVDWHGTTIDGGHRLQTIIDSGKPMKTLVIRGIDPAAVKEVDTGTSRKFNDVCKMLGIDDPVVVASITKRALLWERKVFFTRTGGIVPPTFSDMEEFLINNMALIHPAAGRGRDLANSRTGVPQVPPSIGGFAWYLFKMLQPDQADNFVDQLASGANMPKGSPILALYRQLTRPPQPMERKKTPDEVLAYIIHAWNAWRREETRERFQLTKTGPLDNENFPIPE